MANYPNPNIIINLASGSDLSAAQYKAIVLSSDGAVDLAGVNAKAIGFLMSVPSATVGGITEIATQGGGAKAIAGATVTAGDELTVDSAGDVITAVSGSNVVGIAMESAVDGDVFGILVTTAKSTAAVQEATTTATGVVTPGANGIELNHATVIIAAVVAAGTNHPGYFTVKDTSASGTAAHTVTLTAGTWDGTNTIVTLNAPDEFIVVDFDSAGNGTIVENVGTVVLS